MIMYTKFWVLSVLYINKVPIQISELKPNVRPSKIKMSKKSKLKITCSNLRGLNTGPKLAFKMQHLLKNLNSDVRIVVVTVTTKH